jgi:Kelch motif
MLSRAIVAAVAIPTLVFAFHEMKSGPVSGAALALERPATLGSLHVVSPMLEPRSGHAAVLLANGKVLIVGGMRRNQDFYRTAELYDPATEKFSATGSMALARVGPAAVRLPSGRVLVVGGYVGHSVTDVAEIYDPATGKFSDAGRMTQKRGRPAVTLLTTGDVLITGGSENDGPGGVASAELFHSATGKFEAVAPMHAGRVSHTSILLTDGRVLICGG